MLVEILVPIVLLVVVVVLAVVLYVICVRCGYKDKLLGSWQATRETRETDHWGWDGEKTEQEPASP